MRAGLHILQPRRLLELPEPQHKASHGPAFTTEQKDPCPTAAAAPEDTHSPAIQAAPDASETAGRCVHGCTHRYETLQQIGTQVHRQAERVEKDPTQPAHPSTILTTLGTPLSTQSPWLGATVLGALLKVQFLDEKGDLEPPAHYLQK